MKVEQEKRKEAEEFLRKIKGLNRLYSTAGEVDFVAELVLSDFRAITEALESLKRRPEVKMCRMHHIIEEIEQERYFCAEEKKRVEGSKEHSHHPTA